MAVLPTAEFNGDTVTIHGVRNFRYRSPSDFTPDYYDRAYDLTQLRTVEFLVEPFAEFDAFAHTMLTFGFDNGDQVVISVETRREVGEDWSAWRGLFNEYELMYIIADERDAVYLRTNIRGDDMYLYPTVATPEQAKVLFVDMLNEANDIAAQPRFYNTFMSNCTTNLVKHINRLRQTPIRFSPRYVMPGYSDQLAYDLGLLPNDIPFEELKKRSKADDRVENLTDINQYSRLLRTTLAE